jgi:hypothetical protein
MYRIINKAGIARALKTARGLAHLKIFHPELSLHRVKWCTQAIP